MFKDSRSCRKLSGVFRFATYDEGELLEKLTTVHGCFLGT
jgi:hypothetical protein